VDSVSNTEEKDDDTVTVHWWITNKRCWWNYILKLKHSLCFVCFPETWSLSQFVSMLIKHRKARRLTQTDLEAPLLNLLRRSLHF
jgi:hypothetical protein